MGPHEQNTTDCLAMARARPSATRRSCFGAILVVFLNIDGFEADGRLKNRAKMQPEAVCTRADDTW